MITIRGYYKSVTNYELDLDMTEEEYMSLTNCEHHDLVHGKLRSGEGYKREFIGEENYGVMYIKNFCGNFEELFEGEED